MTLKFKPKAKPVVRICNLNGGDPFRFENTPPNRIYIKICRDGFVFEDREKMCENEPYFCLVTGLVLTIDKKYEVYPVDITVEEK